MSEIEEIEQFEEKPKRPTFLVVLAVLSFISLTMSFFSSLFNLFSGPMDKDAMDLYSARQYESISELRDLGQDGVADLIESTLNMSIYQNNDAFFSFHGLNFIAVVVGIIGVTFMLQLKKLGFHLYVVYSILPILFMYILLPMDLIPSFMIIGMVIISALFCILYALNLKHMK